MAPGAVGRCRTQGNQGRTYIPANPGWDKIIVEMMSEVPGDRRRHGQRRWARRRPGGHAHWSIMVKDTSQVFVAGPPVVAAGMNESVTKEDLGGWEIHSRNGVVDNLAETEADAFGQIGKFLSYLPSNVWEQPAARPPRRMTRTGGRSHSFWLSRGTAAGPTRCAR